MERKCGEMAVSKCPLSLTFGMNTLEGACTYWQELDGYLCLVACLLRMSPYEPQQMILECSVGGKKCCFHIYIYIYE